MADRHKPYSAAIAACLLVALVLAACISLYADPYWIWRERPPWEYSRGMELRMRFAKALQVVERRPGLILLGSSTAYRGLDPDLLSPTHRAYNLGISSLRIAEAEAYVVHTLRYTRVQTIILGLDYFMFDSNRTSEPGFDADLGNVDYVIRSWFSAAVGRDALGDAFSVLRRARADTDGRWQRNGFKRTFPRSAATVSAIARGEYDFYRTVSVGSDGFESLARIVRACREHGVVLKLYITPTHSKFLDMLEALGKAGEFRSWRRNVAEAARAHEVELWDFGRVDPLRGSPLAISDDQFFDSTHFTPSLGAQLMHTMGLQLAARRPASVSAREPRAPADLADAGIELAAVGTIASP